MNRSPSIYLNPRSERCPWDEAAETVLPEAGFERARRAITRWQEYEPTPLVRLPDLARALGIGALFYKDEGRRFATSAFKVLGGAYAVERAVAAADREITVTSATDGNHGRAVAWGARKFGCRCVIYLHQGVSAGRERAIEELGATIVRVGATYDESVEACRRDAESHGRIVIADTSWPGYEEVPRDIMQGYRVMVEEALDQLSSERPSHVVVQAGVGGLAAAVLGHLWWRYGAERPRFVLVEPEAAACCFASARAGRLVPVGGDLETLMAGLSCGEVSPLAWRLLDRSADVLTTLPERFVVPAMQRLASESGIVGGESGVAGVGLLMASQQQENPESQELRAALAIDASSRVLVFGTEGATDPALWQELTGLEPC